MNTNGMIVGAIRKAVLQTLSPISSDTYPNHFSITPIVSSSKICVAPEREAGGSLFKAKAHQKLKRRAREKSKIIHTAIDGIIVLIGRHDCQQNPKAPRIITPTSAHKREKLDNDQRDPSASCTLSPNSCDSNEMHAASNLPQI